MRVPRAFCLPRNVLLKYYLKDKELNKMGHALISLKLSRVFLKVHVFFVFLILVGCVLSSHSIGLGHGYKND